MAALPILRRTAWVALVPQALILGALTVLAWATLPLPDPMAAVLVAFAACAVCMLLARGLLLSHHRNGVIALRRGQLGRAAEEFRASYRRFDAHPWLDRYRHIITFSGSAISYREMALVNEAYARAQAGRVDDARALYQQTLDQYPDSVIARMGLKRMDSPDGE